MHLNNVNDVVKFEQISHIVVKFPFLTLNSQMSTGLLLVNNAQKFFS